MDEQQLMDVATDGNYEHVDINPYFAVLEGQFTVEQLEAVIELIKRESPCSE